MSARAGQTTADAAGESQPASERPVMPWTGNAGPRRSAHEHATLNIIARETARLLGTPCVAELPVSAWPQQPFLVPMATLDSATAHSLGVRTEDDLLGGVVPHDFVATKTITHPLASADATAPPGWSTTFAQQVRGATLAGHAAFSRADALHAGQRLLAYGPVRLKPAGEAGGRGQAVVGSMAALQAWMDTLDDTTLHTWGLVLEHNLRNADTLSVGQVRLGGMQVSYWGRQRQTTNGQDQPAYGGSDLTVVRGDFAALLHSLAPGPLRSAVDQAMVYHAAALACYPGFFASRINYDVVQGVNAAGEWSSGVLEQSWRVGGATPAELAALHALQAHPRLATVHARCVEQFGPPGALPEGATVYYQGDDPEVGPLTKYAGVVPDGHP
ncbi:DUF3182 family protein [Acidovorax sp. RAC01]|uniref:DUF3182 family protein n=1 Tax=Acidovorax sp. RAC01 TaxID=1842533 RepID=UPI001E54BDDF|nr:DUF3182 family protein [Acidovorax sp. RAC01]